MANVTLKTGLNEAEVVHAGVNAAVCRVSASASLSAGDVLRIGRLPHQANVLDAVFYAGAAFPANSIWKFGVSGSDAAFLVSQSYSVNTTSAFAGVAFKANVNVCNVNVSRSDEAPARFTYIVATPTTAVSVGNYGTLVVYYKMPGQNL